MLLYNPPPNKMVDKKRTERDPSRKEKVPKWHVTSSSFFLMDSPSCTWEPCLITSRHDLLRPGCLGCPETAPVCRKFALPRERRNVNKHTMTLWVQFIIKHCETVFSIIQASPGTLHKNTVSPEHWNRQGLTCAVCTKRKTAIHFKRRYVVGRTLSLGRGREDKHLMMMIFFNTFFNSIWAYRKWGLKGLSRLLCKCWLPQPPPAPVWGCVTANTRTAAIMQS